MHLVLLDRWTNLDSPLHRRDPRAKVLGAAGIVVFLALSSRALAFKLPASAALLLGLLLLSRVPPGYGLKRACLVLPFSGMAVASALAGAWLPGLGIRLSAGEALAIVSKSYLSALAVLLLAATTRMPELLKALEQLRVPAVFLMVVHFVYRYLFVLSEEAQHMNQALASRGGARGGWRAAAGMAAVLFARAHARAERVHRAMLARGFHGSFPATRTWQWRAADSAYALALGACLAAIHSAPLWFSRWYAP